MLRAKFYRLSIRAKRSWQKAAKMLKNLGREGKLVFGDPDKRDELLQEYRPPPWVPGIDGAPALVRRFKDQFSCIFSVNGGCSPGSN